MQLTLTHIGAVSLGRLLAIWAFVLGGILLVVYSILALLMGLLSMAAGADVVQILFGVILTLVMGVVGLVAAGIGMFIFGFLSAVVYNIVLGIGGGIDVNFKERSEK